MRCQCITILSWYDLYDHHKHRRHRHYHQRRRRHHHHHHQSPSSSTTIIIIIIIIIIFTILSPPSWSVADVVIFIYHPQPWPSHDDVMKWNYFSRYWPFVRGTHRSPVDSPHKAPVTRTFDVSFDIRLNVRLNRHWSRLWFETPWSSLWRHCNDHCPFTSWNHHSRKIIASITTVIIPTIATIVDFVVIISLPWRHNGHDGVSNHQITSQITIVYSTLYTSADQRKKSLVQPLHHQFSNDALFTIMHYIDVMMSAMASKSPTSRLFTQPFAQAQKTSKITAIGLSDRWIPRTNGQ